MHAPFGYEYLKIAEWCDNNCTFCIIPTIRGRQTSRPIEWIIEEVKVMLSQGIREIQILSQDTTRYGTDIYNEPRLIEMLEAIDAIEGDFTFRVYYLYPDILTLEHLAKIKKLKKWFHILISHFNILAKIYLSLWGATMIKIIFSHSLIQFVQASQDHL